MVVATGEGVRRLALPLDSPEMPKEGMRGRVIGIGTRGWTEVMGWLSCMGVRMGMAGMAGMEGMDGMAGIPTDRFGMEPIPERMTKHEENLREN